MFVADSSGSAYGSAGGPAAGGGFKMPGWNSLALYGSIMQGKAQEAQYRAQGRTLDEQASEKRREAKEVRKTSLWESIRMNEEGRRLLSTQRQIFGQAGVTMEGAPTALMERTEGQIVADRMMLAHNTGVEVSALKREAWSLKQQANAYNQAAGDAEKAGIIGAFSSFFG